MPDGPSLGGFVCPATIPSAELWKMGQVRLPCVTEPQNDRLCRTNQTLMVCQDAALVIDIMHVSLSIHHADLLGENIPTKPLLDR
jgi:Carboxyltransferase domain, subdomain A and B